MQKSIRNFFILAVFTLSFLLSACKPENIILTNTSLENKMHQWTQETCRQRPDGTCKLMGEK